MKPITTSNSIWWRKIEYPVYTPEEASSLDGKRPRCPHCKSEEGYHPIASLWQAGFWEDVNVALCQCGHCEKPFAVRSTIEKVMGWPSDITMTLEEGVIVSVEQHFEDGYEDKDDDQ